MALPDELKTPVTNIDEAYAWIRGLAAAGLSFHFDDGPESIVNFKTNEPIFSPEEAENISARLDEIYGLHDWGQELCPIGVLIMHEGLDGYNLYDHDEYRLRGTPTPNHKIVCWAEGPEGLMISDCYAGHDDPGSRFEVSDHGKVVANFHLFEEALAYVKGA